MNQKSQIKKQIYDQLGDINFDDIGDTNTVILPMAFLDRFNVNQRMIVDIEKRMELGKNKELEKIIQSLKLLEIEKEKKLEQIVGKPFYDEYLRPKEMDRFCYMRTLVLYYFSIASGQIDTNKKSQHVEIGILSYLNFHYPSGNLEILTEKTTYADIDDAVKHLPPQSKEKFLQTMKLDEETLALKVEEEKRMSDIQKKRPYGLMDSEDTDSVKSGDDVKSDQGQHDDDDQMYPDAEWVADKACSAGATKFRAHASELLVTLTDPIYQRAIRFFWIRKQKTLFLRVSREVEKEDNQISPGIIREFPVHHHKTRKKEDKLNSESCTLFHEEYSFRSGIFYNKTI